MDWKKSALAVALLGSAATANASQFYIDTAGTGLGVASDYDATVCATCSSLKDEMTFQYDSSTVITLTGPGVSVGDSIVTTGGLNVGGTFDADNVNSNLVTGFDPASQNAGAISSPGLLSAIPGSFSLSFAATLNGQIAATDGLNVTEVSYSSGLIEVYAIVVDADSVLDADGSSAFDTIHLFDMSVVSSDFSNASNFLVLGDVAFSGNEDPAFADFFNISGADCAGSGNSFSDLSSCVPPITVEWVLDQNLDQVAAIIDPLTGTATISGDHDGSIRFQVPTPAPLFLMGAALLGLGTLRRKFA